MTALLLLFMLVTSNNKVAISLEQSSPSVSQSDKLNDNIEVYLDIPKPFKQGSSVIIHVNSKKELITPKISFAGKITTLFKTADTQYLGLGAVDALVKPGGYTLKVYDDGGNLNFTELIEVSPGKFPVQNISISGTKASLEPTQDELDKVDAAKKNVSGVNYWISKPFKVPTKGPVVSVYGLNRYHNGKSTGDYHKGQDIKAPQGAPIVATADGTVLIAEKFRLHGGTVSIDHGQGLMSIYIHMSKIAVKKGDRVTKGQKIGEVGSTGFATGPHLHWGLYVYGIPVNPREWL